MRPNTKPISAANTASITVLPTARDTSSATDRPVAIEVPRSPLHRVPEPDAELHRQRPVEAVGLRICSASAGRGIGRQHRDQRIAGRDVHQQEAHERHREHDRHHQDQALGDVDEHRYRPRDGEGATPRTRGALGALS